MLGHEKRTKGLLLVPRADLSPKGDFYKENKTAAKSYWEEIFLLNFTFKWRKMSRRLERSETKEVKDCCCCIFIKELRTRKKKKCWKCERRQKYSTRSYYNKCNAISENYSEKKLLPPNLPKVASSCLPIYLFSNSSENELEAMYFSCFTNRCSFIMASIMWKVPQYYWIVSAYTSNTFFFVTHSGEYKDSVCFRFFTENSTTNWPWHLWTLNIRVWKNITKILFFGVAYKWDILWLFSNRVQLLLQ